MQLNDLKPTEGAKRARKRIGRGNASGTGTTAGKGTKGQLSRSGGGKGVGFEGGQNPLAHRLPKLPGFKNRNRVEYAVVNLDRLSTLFKDGDTVDGVALMQAGVIKKPTVAVKVLAKGELDKKLTVKVAKVSKSAAKKIEAAGGKVE